MYFLITRLVTPYTSIANIVYQARLEEILVQAHHYHSQEMQDPTFQGRTELKVLQFPWHCLHEGQVGQLVYPAWVGWFSSLLLVPPKTTQLIDLT